jgi:uncharacterized protein
MSAVRSRGAALRVDRDLAVEMRDGILTYADVYRPARRGRFPVILQRTPYDRTRGGPALSQINPLRAVDRGYAVVVQDCRGRYASQGDFEPFHQELADGYDSVEWCGHQSWANGEVGMIGASYAGAVQWLAAVEAPPSLRCIVPAVTSSDHYEGWTYRSGALQWGFIVSWVIPTLAGEAFLNRRFHSTGTEELRRRLIQGIDDLSGLWSTLPLRDLPLVAELAPYVLDWISHATNDAYWRKVSVEDRHERVAVPALNIGGWYDIFQAGTIRNFVGLRGNGATAAARDGTRLIMGPWAHSWPTEQAAGLIDFGVESSQGWTPMQYDLDGDIFAFLDRWLAGDAPGAENGPPIRLFTMGENRWRGETAWPLERTDYQRLYLRSSGRAGTSASNGRLSPREPRDERPDAFAYDPRQAVPTTGGQLCCYPAQFAPGALDQRPLEGRPDVLVYTSDPLRHDLEVTGPIRATLWAVTDAPDTDFTAKLVSVEPNGLAINLTDGLVRARYRRGTDAARPITPHEPLQYGIDLGATSNLFRAGQRIRLEVSSSNFPRFDRNLNTGHPIGADAQVRIARQTILHDREHASFLELPVIPR